MTGELVPIGPRPRLVASFDPPGADEAFRAWRERNAAVLVAFPPQHLRVEYGRAQEGGLFVRVRVAEDQFAPALVP